LYRIQILVDDIGYDHTYTGIARPRAEIARLDPHRGGVVLEIWMLLSGFDNFLRLRNFGGVRLIDRNAKPHWVIGMSAVEKKKDLAVASFTLKKSQDFITDDIRGLYEY
jgi:hypothetical protein